jgi:hypothetical protein
MSTAASPYLLSLVTNLLIQTLHLCTTFTRYGLYAHIATTAAESLGRLSYINSPARARLAQVQRLVSGSLNSVPPLYDSFRVMRTLRAACIAQDAVVNLVDEQCLTECGWSIPFDVWSRGGLRTLKPFIVYDLVPHVDDGKEQDEETLRVWVVPLLPTSHFPPSTS